MQLWTLFMLFSIYMFLRLTPAWVYTIHNSLHQYATGYGPTNVFLEHVFSVKQCLYIVQKLCKIIWLYNVCNFLNWFCNPDWRYIKNTMKKGTKIVHFYTVFRTDIRCASANETDSLLADRGVWTWVCACCRCFCTIQRAILISHFQIQ